MKVLRWCGRHKIMTLLIITLILVASGEVNPEAAAILSWYMIGAIWLYALIKKIVMKYRKPNEKEVIK